MPRQSPWLKAFPELDRVNDAVWRDVAASAVEHHLPADSALLKPGDRIEGYPLVRDGSIKVTRTSDRGRDLMLYRVESGEGCTLCTALLLSGGTSPVTAVAEVDTDVVVIGAREFHLAYADSPGFRAFITRSYARRFNAIVDLIDQLTFRPVDSRLATWLVTRARGAQALEISHQDLATELGTAREVVSRLLKGFERDGLVRLGRARIDIIDRQRLTGVAERVEGAGQTRQ